MSNRITRRRFVQNTSAGAAAALAVAAPRVFAASKLDTKHPVIGEGEFRYECIHDWGMDSLPDGAHYGDASHGVTIDEQGLIYITHYGEPGSIYVFDPAGRFVRSMGDFHMVPRGDRKVAQGHGIDIRKEGGEEFLYLSASHTGLGWAKINLQGELVWQKGLKEIREETGKYQGDKPRYRPTNASFAPDGGYFLGDGYGSSYVHQYDKEDRFVRTLGGDGDAAGQFRTPHGQWLDARDGMPKLVVADRANKRLQWFDMDGQHVSTLDGFLFPADIDTQGDLMLVPDLHARVTLLDKDNQVITHLGGQGDFEAWKQKALDKFAMRRQRDQWQPGRFVHPHDACFDQDGNIFVTEWVATGRVTKLRKVG